MFCPIQSVDARRTAAATRVLMADTSSVPLTLASRDDYLNATQVPLASQLHQTVIRCKQYGVAGCTTPLVALVLHLRRAPPDWSPSWRSPKCRSRQSVLRISSSSPIPASCTRTATASKSTDKPSTSSLCSPPPTALSCPAKNSSAASGPRHP